MEQGATGLRSSPSLAGSSTNKLLFTAQTMIQSAWNFNTDQKKMRPDGRLKLRDLGHILSALWQPCDSFSARTDMKLFVDMPHIRVNSPYTDPKSSSNF